MPGTNLTRDEAAERAELLDVESYAVEIDLTVGGTATFGSTSVLRFRATTGTDTFVDLVGATVRDIRLNGVHLDPEEVYAGNRIALADLAEDNELRVVADMRYSNTGEGLHRFVDPADDRVYLYSQCEVPDARRIYAAFEQPDLKSVFTFTVKAPEHWKVVSNAPTPAPEYAGDGTAVWSFPTTERMSTYVTAVVAGEYHEVLDTYTGKHGEIPLGHYCRQSIVPFLDLDELVLLTKQGFEFFEAAFEFPYPFHKYDQLYVPEFNNGAMENAGCVTLRDEYLPRSNEAGWFYEQRANTILHEMAHMWFGDLVTMKWWDDLWLNESFAEWAAAHASVHATSYTDAWTGFANNRKNWAYRQDQLPSTHPIAADNHDLEAVEVNFDGITYAKGASVLKQLVAYVGLEAFLAGLRSYFQEHAFGNSEFSDLLEALEATSGRDLDAWASAWLQTSGVNTLSPEFSLDETGSYASFTVRQTQSDDSSSTLRPHRIGIGLYDHLDGRLARRTVIESDVVGEVSEVAGLIGVRQPDLLLLNDGDLTYAKIRLDPRSLATARESVRTLEDSLARALCWSAVWDMTRDAELSAGDFVTMVLGGLADESDDTAVKQLPVYVQIAIEQFAHPSKRDALRATWEQGLRTILEAAEPGSDHQLTFMKVFAGTTGKRIPPSSYAGAGRSAEAMSFMAGLLDGSTGLAGLVVDTDMRWTLLTALASTGYVDRARIDEELAGDQTSSGHEKAAAAVAALRDPAAKEHSWLEAVERDGVPNETQRHIAYIWDTAGQPDLIAPYLERYLAAAETIWEARGTQIASTALEYMFPRALTSKETLDRVGEWLQSSAANPAAKRYVREGGADLVRALRAQAFDAPA
ncbi:aminopeptidase N [soil metagenome]